MVILREISEPSDLEINSGTTRSSNSMDIHYPKQKSGFRPNRQARVENRQKTHQVPFLNNIALILDAELLHLQ